MLFFNTVLLTDVAFLPFSASVLADAFRTGHGEGTAVVFHGIAFELAAILFNIMWWHARQGRRLLVDTIGPASVHAITRRFRLALAWIATGSIVGGACTPGRCRRFRSVHCLLLAADSG